MSPPQHSLLSALPEHNEAHTSASRSGLPPWSAFRESVMSPLYPLSKTLLERLKAHLPGSSMSHLRNLPLQLALGIVGQQELPGKQ